jgi:hypothetical protein
MSQSTEAPHTIDPLDELVEQLLDCGGVLSQLVTHMVENRESGRSSPDAAPIPEILRTLIRSVAGGLRKRHSKRDIRIAAAIVEQLTTAMCEELYFVPPEPDDEE